MIEGESSMRSYQCQAILRNGMRCGKAVEHETPDKLCLCEGCYRKYLIAPGGKMVSEVRA